MCVFVGMCVDVWETEIKAEVRQEKKRQQESEGEMGKISTYDQNSWYTEKNIAFKKIVYTEFTFIKEYKGLQGGLHTKNIWHPSWYQMWFDS